jgi:Ser/Thr protein kinase RdoA (MazF antagonist)
MRPRQTWHVDAGYANEIADRFALGRAKALTGPHARGHQGEVWRLATDLGLWAVKRSFSDTDEAELVGPAALQEAAQRAGISTPRIARTVDGTVLADLRMGAVRVDEWVDLFDPDTHIDPSAVGETAARLHLLTANLSTSSAWPPNIFDHDIDPWYHSPVGADRWNDLFDQLSAAGAPFADALSPQQAELVAMDAMIEAPQHIQICHRDLWADNVRRGFDERIWVIDWQDCGAADPSHELAALLFEYAYDDRDRARALHSAYVAAGGPGRVNATGHFSMAIAQLGHLLEIACTRWLSATSIDDRRLNETRVDEFITKPMSRELIDRLIDAVAG